MMPYEQLDAFKVCHELSLAEPPPTLAIMTIGD